MNVELVVRNESDRKYLYRSDVLHRLAERVFTGEGVKRDVEVSALFCDDPFIQNLNRQYRKKDSPTDVLSFAQTDTGHGPLQVLGDIVISLETVERQCDGERQRMRDEVKLLFCHGLLHLLGNTHETQEKQERMQAKQAAYLGITQQAAWRTGLKFRT